MTSRRLVLGDASTMMRRIVGQIFTTRGWTVIEAVDGVDLVRTVFREQPDLVLTDVALPRLSGWVATRLLKDDWATSDIPVVLLTALSGASDRFWSERSGGDLYLTKDFEPGDLALAVTELVSAKPRDEHRPDPAELADTEILERSAELLDRTLFHATVAADVAAVSSLAHGFEATVAALLEVLGRVVDHALVGLVLAEERKAYLAAAAPMSQNHLTEAVRRAGEELGHGHDDLDVLVVDPQAHVGALRKGDLGSFLAVPMHGYGGAVIGVLAFSSSDADAFGDAELRTLRAVEGPAALVLDAARLTARRLGV